MRKRQVGCEMACKLSHRPSAARLSPFCTIHNHDRPSYAVARLTVIPPPIVGESISLMRKRQVGCEMTCGLWPYPGSARPTPFCTIHNHDRPSYAVARLTVIPPSIVGESINLTRKRRVGCEMTCGLSPRPGSARLTPNFTNRGGV